MPLAEQDRRRWDRRQIDEGIAVLTRSLAAHRPGPYQLQAAISAVHAEAETYAATDWPQILALYDVLDALADDPVVTLNRAVALAQVRGPAAGLGLARDRGSRPAAGRPPPGACRARPPAPRRWAGPTTPSGEFRTAARRTLSVPERHYLLHQAALTEQPGERDRWHARSRTRARRAARALVPELSRSGAARGPAGWSAMT